MEVFANSNLNLPTFHLYFNRQNLVDFEPLQSVVSDFLKVEPTPKEYPLFYKNDYFDLSECESMITGYDPSDNWQCSERQQAYSLVLSSVHNGLFEPHPHRENDYLISAENFRAWLKSKDIFIDGFTNTPNNINTQPDSQLLQQIADLNAQLASAGDTIKRQAKEIADLKAQLEQQPNQPSDTAADEPLKGIAKVNYDKDKAKAFASIVAKFLWNIDTNQQLRIGEMATQLYPLIHEFDNNALPQGNDTIKDWIRPHAPKYASKAGNTPKSQPPIILTLKK